MSSRSSLLQGVLRQSAADSTQRSGPVSPIEDDDDDELINVVRIIFCLISLSLCCFVLILIFLPSSSDSLPGFSPRHPHSLTRPVAPIITAIIAYARCRRSRTSYPRSSAHHPQ